MSFRTRLAFALALLALAPLVAFGLGVRERVQRDLSDRYRRETGALAAGIRAELGGEGRAIERRLRSVAGAAERDNQLRRAIRAGGEPGYLLDYAGRVMPLAGLAMLQLQDGDGRILSSGQFRNEYGRVEPGVAAAVNGAPGRQALVRVPMPSATFLALVRAVPVRVGERTLDLVGGVRVDSAFLTSLAPGSPVGLDLVLPGRGAVARVGASAASVEEGSAGSGSAAREVTEEIELPYLDAAENGPGRGGPASARLVVTRSLGPLEALLRGIDLWFLAALALVAAAALLAGRWTAAWLSEPLSDLARRTARLDLERLDVDFPTDRTDEIGTLARGLGALTARLRMGAARLREAERRATLGEVARQVNHDVRNGLTPLRHVVRHLAEVARDDPEGLARVFEERRSSLEGGLGYLETLASRYARLSSRPEPRPCDAAAVARAVVGAADGRVVGEIEEDLAPVLADPVALRRILDNLVRNALESLGPGAGRVTVRVRRAAGPDGAPGIGLEVEDTGPGMSAKERSRIFEEFYTTREDGAGLGLAIVHRLVTDMGGTVDVESRPGSGTRFAVGLPAAPADA